MVKSFQLSLSPFHLRELSHQFVTLLGEEYNVFRHPRTLQERYGRYGLGHIKLFLPTRPCRIYYDGSQSDGINAYAHRHGDGT